MRRRTILTATALMVSLSFAACTKSTNQYEEQSKMSEQSATVLINPFVVPENKLDETIIMWEQARDYLQTQPGYISTELHQSLGPDATFRLINVAKWESPEAFMTASKKMAAEADLPKIEGVVANPSLFTVIRRD